MEETIQIPRHFGPVTPRIPTWRDQEEEEKEEQQHYGVPLLDYYPNRMQNEKLKMEENE